MAPTFNRRDFLTYSGATLAGVTLGETGRRWLARADERAASAAPAAADLWATSICRECPAGCGVRVRVYDGAPVKLEGNPRCPIARGRLCAKGQAALEAYFDPDRLIGPARRVGQRGENRWEPMTWPDAIALLASHIDPASPDGAIVALADDEAGPIADVWSRFWTAVHARVAWTLAPGTERLAPAFRALTGADGDPVFDVERATYVLSFGAPLVEDWLSPLWAQRSYGRFRRGASRPRGRLVQIDQRRSLTARKADEWLPVSADRQATLAYGIASVLLREDRIDRRLLRELGGTIADFEAEIVARYPPDVVALATGVPVVALLRLGRELTATPQPLVITAADAPRDLVDAVFALNALAGTIERPGGLFVAPARQTAARDGHSAAAAIADLAARPVPAAVVALRDGSALRSLSAPHGAAGALDRSGFVVSFSPYLDEAAAHADLLLPTHTPLESWHAIVPPNTDGSEKFACVRPVVAPRLDTRDLVAVLRMAAEAIGGELPSHCPPSSADAIDPEIDRLWNLRRGSPYATGFEINWVRQLERGGWWVPPAAARDEFARAVVEAGGWTDPYVGVGPLRQAIARHDGLTFLPPAASPLEVAAPSPPMLRLVAFTPSTVNLAGSPNQPVLFELLGQPDNAPWRAWAEINPQTAQRLGIVEGGAIRISSTAGSIEVAASLVEHTPAGTIAVAYVPAMRHGGRWARRVDSDVRRLWQDGSPRGSIDVRVEAI
jgi:anaerobic selenocysteine-containing dehydrogenase